jgi:hypothetical protein
MDLFFQISFTLHKHAEWCYYNKEEQNVEIKVIFRNQTASLAHQNHKKIISVFFSSGACDSDRIWSFILQYKGRHLIQIRAT